MDSTVCLLSPGWTGFDGTDVQIWSVGPARESTQKCPKTKSVKCKEVSDGRIRGGEATMSLVREYTKGLRGFTGSAGILLWAAFVI